MVMVDEVNFEAERWGKGWKERLMVRRRRCMGRSVEYYINITFPERVIVENIIPRNVIINRGAAEVDNRISREISSRGM